VTDEQNRRAARLHLADAVDALMLEHGIADRQRLVDEQHVGVDVDRRGEGEADEHPARIHLDRLVHKVADAGKALNVRKTSTDFGKR
jgi:hypothetical protein